MELRSGTVKSSSESQHRAAKSLNRLLTEEQAALFHQGIGLVLARWTALQLAIHNEWGGPSSQVKAQQLHHDIFDWMLHSKERLYIDELEDFLDENLLQQFNTETEDGSLEEVAQKLMSMYEDCAEGNFETTRELILANCPATSLSTLNSKQVEADVAEEIVDHTETATAGDVIMDTSPDCDGQQTIEEKVDMCVPIDEDSVGWQLVSSRSRRKPRK